jgi:hypothetical protein
MGHVFLEQDLLSCYFQLSYCFKIRDSSVGIATGPRAGRSGF